MRVGLLLIGGPRSSSAGSHLLTVTSPAQHPPVGLWLLAAVATVTAVAAVAALVWAERRQDLYRRRLQVKVAATCSSWTEADVLAEEAERVAARRERRARAGQRPGDVYAGGMRFSSWHSQSRPSSTGPRRVVIDGHTRIDEAS